MWNKSLNNKKPLNENPSVKKSAPLSSPAAVTKKPSVNKETVKNFDGKTAITKNISDLIGWQIS